MSQFLHRLPVLALGGAVLAAGSAWALNQKGEADKSNAKAAPQVTIDERPLARDAKPGVSFAPVVRKVSASVVRVDTMARVKQTSLRGMPDMSNPWLRRFFGDEAEGLTPRMPFNVPPQRGTGSGVIVSKDGYILTNNHVVDGADEVKVGLQDGRQLTAKVVGKDPKTDVAVLKVDAKDLPSIQLADSDKIEVGDVVLAIGNPFGIGQTVTMGMVSAMGRATLGLDYEDFIQTDAAINPGNSGGALVDAEGRLIGINTAILSRTGGNQGIGFAIPTNLARDVMDNLIKDGRVVRGYMGVMIQDVTPALAKEFKLKDNTGALVGGVEPKGPAEKAGLQSGDVILELNGKNVRDSRHLKLEVGRAKPGEAVTLKVLRDGSPKTINVTLRELPGSEKVAKADTDKSAGDNGTLNGVGVTELDRQARRELNVPENVRGAVVSEVEPGSAAAEAGLRPGDVILEINKQPVRSADDAVRLTEKAKDKTTLLKIWSQGGSRYVVVDESNAS